jgi:single-stranded DNA-binding protein
MHASLNRVTLLGVCGKYGFSLRSLPTGAVVASGSITITEPCKDGRVFETYFAVEVYGQKAEQASTLKPGAPIFIEGKLAKRKDKSGNYETVVNCFQVQPLEAGRSLE